MSHDDGFSEYVAARWATLLRSAALLGCDLHEAQDIAQTTLMQCYASWDKVKRASDRDAYVYKVMLNCLRTSRRRRWWGETATDFMNRASPDTSASVDHELTDALVRALKALPEATRAVVVLRFYADLSEQQTARALRIPLGTVKSRLARGVSALAQDPHLAELPGWSTK